MPGAGATVLEGGLRSRSSQRERGRDNCAGSCNETGVEGKVHLSSGCLGSAGEEHRPRGPGEDSGKEGSGMSQHEVRHARGTLSRTPGDPALLLTPLHFFSQFTEINRQKRTNSFKRV